MSAALALGLRGFPRGGSIPRFLDEHRGRYNMGDQRFTVGQILEWADAWQAQTGVWPMSDSGAIPGAGGVNWRIVDDSLRVGRGVLPGGSSLPQLLMTERGAFAPYTEEQILAWADAFSCASRALAQVHFRSDRRRAPVQDVVRRTWWSPQQGRSRLTPRWFVAPSTTHQTARDQERGLRAAVGDSTGSRMGRCPSPEDRAMAHEPIRADSRGTR